MNLFRGLIIAGTTRLIQKLVPCNTPPDVVYDFLVSKPDDWFVFIGTPSIHDIGRLPKMDKWLWGREPFALPAFRVPKLQDALVTAYCISKAGMTELVTFASHLDRTRTPIQQEAENRCNGQQVSPGDVANRAAPEK